MKFLALCIGGGVFDSAFCPGGRGFVHNDCPGGGFLPSSNRLPGACPGGRRWFWMNLIVALYVKLNARRLTSADIGLATFSSTATVG